MNARELRQKRKQWKENSKVYRNKKAIAHQNFQRIIDVTPPPSPVSVVQQIREDVAARNRRQMRRRRAILYAKIANLEKKLKNAVKLSEKYKKRYLRIKTKKTDPESPGTKVDALLKNVNVPESVKKKLLFGEALTRDLETSYKDLGKKHEKKKKYYEMLKLKSLQKYKLLHASKPFFKHDTYKRQKPRKISDKMMKVKDDVIKFLEKDENSRMCPGKKDYLKSKNDYSENYCCKYNEEIQAVHFGGGRKQITMHTGVLYLRKDNAIKPVSFCSLSSDNRHDTMAVWAHLKPIFEWIKTQHLPISRLHMLSDGPVNQYKNKFMFEMVCRHLKDLYPEITYFSWHYSEPGYGKGAPDGVDGTLKRTADKVVAEGHDIIDLNSLKPILQSRCPSILLFEVTTADISLMDDLIKQSKTIPTFRGAQKVRQFAPYSAEDFDA
ncbi:unnamed protein product [Brassicogethes aeneus]|uniref:Uncharacterized protein n=1 Tax=Brassicogethes aeneus TaxID=1431903 RepID=A0A9P0B4U1_BRAAE|nr:unnamed protein product [Brassicogethes aeneus]